MKNNLTILYQYSAAALLIFGAVLTSCQKNGDISIPKANALSPDSAAGGSVLTLTGNGLAGMRMIIFEKDSIPAPFNPVFNTDRAVIFRVPDTAYGGSQNITFINKDGKSVSMPFNVIALATVSSASIYEFTTGTSVILTGNNLDDVTDVTLNGTADKATIISKTHKTLEIEMPATTRPRVKLDITNSSGVMTTSQEFISVDNALHIFTEDFGPGIFNWSWSSASVSADAAVLGTQALKSVYGAGGWQAVSLHCDPALDASQYSYLTFWVKGGTEDNQVDVKSENGGTTQTITVPANVWTYYKFRVSGFITGFPIERLDFQIHGPDNGDQTLYFDDILLVK